MVQHDVYFGEDFGQRVDLTQRIAEIIKNYPDNTILKELIQNADDACASTVRFVLDKRQHNTETLVYEKLASFQGPALIAYNDGVFSEDDFQSISRIGGSLKRDKVFKTGRFGIGFNSVYHVTDVPSFVSGDRICFFDPHADYLPHVSTTNPGKMLNVTTPKVRETIEKYPDQFAPYRLFGCTLESYFKGTMFRLPLRVPHLAKLSRISKVSYTEESVGELFADFMEEAPHMLLFLKSVRVLELYVIEADGAEPQLQFCTSIANATPALLAQRQMAQLSTAASSPTPSAVSNTLDLSISVQRHPQDAASARVEQWLVCQSMGDGDAHRFSKSDTVGKYKLQFLPWGGVACQIPPSEAGRAFCFLPLPVKTRLPFFVNGYFELSSNRRDIWWGEDLVGEGRVRAQWNRVLLTDVIPHNHVRLVTVAQGKCDPAALGGYYQLFPREALEEPWGLVVTHFYRRIVSLPVLHTFAKRDSGGCWVSPKEAIFMDTDSPVDRAVLQATLVSLGMPITDPPAHVVAMLQQTADLMRCSPRLIRNLLRPTPSYSFVPDARHTAVQLLLYCLSDIAAGADEAVYRELLGLNLIPTCDGGFAAVAGAGDGPRLYVCQDAEVELLRPWYRQVLIDLEALPESIVEVLRSPAMQARTNVTTATPAIVARLVQGVTPTQWEGRRTVPPADWEAHPGGLYHREWLTKLWRYIERRGGDLKAFEGLPVLATEEQHLCFLRPLQASTVPVVHTDGIPPCLKTCLGALQCFTLDAAVVPAALPSLWHYVNAPTAAGVLFALQQLCAGEPRKVEPLFEGVGAPDRDALRDFLAQKRWLLPHTKGHLDKSCVPWLRALPVFRALGGAGDAPGDADGAFVAMGPGGTLFLPPANVPPDVLRGVPGVAFLRVADGPAEEAAEPRSTAGLAQFMGVTRPSEAFFYGKQVLPRLGRMAADARNGAATALLQNALRLVQEDRGLKALLQTAPLVPTRAGGLAAVQDLYHPDSPQFAVLLDDADLPDPEFATPDLLPILSALGLRAELSREGLVRVLAGLARTAQAKGAAAAVARAQAALTYLDTHGAHLLKSKGLFSTFLKTSSEMSDEAFTQHLLTTPWLPVCTRPPDDELLLPWSAGAADAAVPLMVPGRVRPASQMWFVSACFGVLDGAVRSPELVEKFGWDRPIEGRVLAMQLDMIARKHRGLLDPQAEAGRGDGDPPLPDEEARRRCEAMTVKCNDVVPKLYALLDQLQKGHAQQFAAVKQMLLDQEGCIWVGDRFVAIHQIAFHTPANAHPYLHVVPRALYTFTNLLTALGVRRAFSPDDFVAVLHKIAQECPDSERPLGASQLDLSVALVQHLADHPPTGVQTVFVPNIRDFMSPAADLVYDDAKWLPGDGLAQSSGAPALLCHPLISNSVAEKVGVCSRRRNMLARSSDVLFELGGEVEAFGQHESITSRIRHILELYPDGHTIINELIQNADDAGATEVSIVLDKGAYGTKSILSPSMADWQGPAICFHNNSTFSAQDFKNLASIGQGSKLEKLGKTGRFGLGFNAVYHFTDVPSFVSGGNVVFFDPHTQYLPGVTASQPGLKLRIPSDVPKQFPDQFAPYRMFGCDLAAPYAGTLFRFPLRTKKGADLSEIKNGEYTLADIEKLLQNFYQTMDQVLLFLKSVTCIRVFVRDGDSLTEMGGTGGSSAAGDEAAEAKDPTAAGPDAAPAGPAPAVGAAGPLRPLFSTSLHMSDVEQQFRGLVTQFVTGDRHAPLTKKAFFERLAHTPEYDLPSSQATSGQHSGLVWFALQGRPGNPIDEQRLNDVLLTIVTTASDGSGVPPQTHTDQWLVCIAIGGGRARQLSLQQATRASQLRLVPWAGAAAHLARNGAPVLAGADRARGRAYCFLPLPAETGLPVHVNGYFELSSNRRNIWYGDDMQGEGEIRSRWNLCLLEDVAASVYSHMLLLLRDRDDFNLEQYYSLFPPKALAEPWRSLALAVYKQTLSLPTLHSRQGDGKWVAPRDAVYLEQPDGPASPTKAGVAPAITEAMLEVGVPLVDPPEHITCMLRQAGLALTALTPALVRATLRQKQARALLADRARALGLLEFCLADMEQLDGKGRLMGTRYPELHGLPLVPLANQGFGTFAGGDPAGQQPAYYVCTDAEHELLAPVKHLLVQREAELPEAIRAHLKSPQLHAQTNIRPMAPQHLPGFLGHLLPREWQGRDEVPHGWQDRVDPDWFRQLWAYLCERQCPLADLTGWPLIVTGSGALCKLTADSKVVHGEGAEEAVLRCLAAVGVPCIDPAAMDTRHPEMARYVQPWSGAGVLDALRNCCADLVTEMPDRFAAAPPAHKRALRAFLAAEHAARPGQLTDMHTATLALLPVWEVGAGDEGGGPAGAGPSDAAAPVFVQLAGAQRYIPPDGVPDELLGPRFLRVPCKAEEGLLNAIGVQKLSMAAFYSLHLFPRLSELDPGARDEATLAMLRDLDGLRHSDASVFEQLKGLRFLPSDDGTLRRVDELYAPALRPLGILDAATAFPAAKFAAPDVLEALEVLGLQRDLTLTSVLAAARSLARCAAAPCSQAEAGRVVARAQRLLRHLNEGVDDCTALGADVPDAASFLKDLREIPWLPVLRQPPPAELCVPWNVKALPDAGKPPLMAPVRVRPAAQLHVASYCYGVLDGQATTATQERFGWTQGPGARELAVQLLQLADTHRAAVGAPDAGGTEGAAVEATGNASGTPTAVSRSVGRQFDAIFSALQALHCPAADAEAPSEEAAGAPRADAGWAAAGVMLQAADCVWASEYGRFYALSSLAFGSDIDAAPHLITVRESLTQFSDLLRALGVRALFDIRDYLALLQAWHRRADASGPSRALDATELELAVQIANAVSQSPENAEAAKQTALYLPDAEGRLAAVNELCYNDAEWLMDAQAQARHVRFVHPAFQNSLAEGLGVQSLRYLMLVDQKLTTSVSCPTASALRQYLGVRSSAGSVGLILDALAVADAAGAKSFRVMFDMRSHGQKSLLQPSLSAFQGPALCIYFDAVLTETDLYTLQCPDRCDARVGGQVLRSGNGLADAYRVTDLVQVVSGASLMLFDPNGAYLHDGSDGAAAGAGGARAPTAKTYAFVDTDLPQRFPDQFAPFMSSGFLGVQPPNRLNATFLRLPLRTPDQAQVSAISPEPCTRAHVLAMLSRLKALRATPLVFATRLESLSVLLWAHSAPRPAVAFEALLANVTHTLRSVRQQLLTDLKWKSFKISALFRSYTPPKVSYTLKLTFIDNHVPALAGPSDAAPAATAGDAGPDAAAAHATDAVPTDAAMATAADETSFYSADTEPPSDTDGAPGSPAEETGGDAAAPGPAAENGWDAADGPDAEDAAAFRVSEERLSNELWLVALSLGAGRSRELALDRRYEGLDLVPLGGVACLWSVDGLVVADVAQLRRYQGCGLTCGPAPVPGVPDTGLPVNIMAASIHRWYRCAGALRDAEITEWNTALLSNVWRAYGHVLSNPTEGLWARQLAIGPGPHMYKYWPVGAGLNDPELVEQCPQFYRKIADSPVFLLKGALQELTRGFFPSATLSERARAYIYAHVPLFDIPAEVSQELVRHAPRAREFSPQGARDFFARRDFAFPPLDVPTAVDFLEFCASDLRADQPRDGRKLRGVRLLPLQSGEVVAFAADRFVVATRPQQALLPAMRSVYVHAVVLESAALEPFFKSTSLCQEAGLLLFSPQLVAAQLRTVLPPHWRGAQFVKVDTPERYEWLHRFWRFAEAAESCAQFREWPLVPLEDGQLMESSLAPAAFMFEAEPAEEVDSGDAALNSSDGTANGTDTTAPSTYDDPVLKPLMATLGVPVIDPAFCKYFVPRSPPDTSGPRRTVCKLGALQAPERACWDDLPAPERLRLLEYFATEGQYNPHEKEQLKRLPLFQTYSGQPPFVPINQGTYFTFDAPHPYFDPVERSFLQPQCAPLLAELGVQHLQEPDIWRDHLLPRFHTLDAAQRLVQMEYLRDHSDIITEGGPEDLLQALGRAPFIPTEDGGFLAAQELIDPRNEVLCSVFDNSDRRFPGAEFATPVWLPFLELIGMKTQIDTDLLLEAAQAIEKHQDDVAEDAAWFGKAKLVVEIFVQQFDQLMDRSADMGAFLQRLAPIRFVPLPSPTAPRPALFRYSEACLAADHKYVWRTRPALPPAFTPNPLTHEVLGLRSPPDAGAVVDSLALLDDDCLEPPAWPFAEHPRVVFGAVWRLLAGQWPRMPPALKARLGHCACVPVGRYALQRPSRLYRACDTPLPPFLHVLPADFQEHWSLFMELGAHPEPNVPFFAKLLPQIYREYQDVPLTPTELSSVLTLLNLLHDNAALPDPFYVPDEDNALRSTGHCFFNDAPWLLHRIRRDGIYFTHARISAEAAAKWRIPSLSKVVKEHIDRSFLEACEASVQAAASARLTRTLQSRALAEGIHSVMCYCNANPLSLLDGDAVYKALSVFRVKVVGTLQTCLTLNGQDITASAHGSVSFVDIDDSLVYVVQGPPYVRMESSLAGCVCRILDLPVLPFVTDMLCCEPHQIGDLLLHLHLPSNSALLPLPPPSTPAGASPSSSSSSTSPSLPPAQPPAHAKPNNSRDRCIPGCPVTPADAAALQLKPLAEYTQGEVVAWKDANGVMRYGCVLVTPAEDAAGAGPDATPSALQQVKLRLGVHKVALMLASEIYCFRHAAPLALAPAQPRHRAAAEAPAAPLAQGCQPAEKARDDIISVVTSLLSKVDVDLSLDKQDLMRRICALQTDLKKADRSCVELQSAVRRLEDEKEALSSKMCCPICYSNPVDTLLLECGHCLCSGCAKRLMNDSCPVCRLVIVGTHRMFL